MTVDGRVLYLPEWNKATTKRSGLTFNSHARTIHFKCEYNDPPMCKGQAPMQRRVSVRIRHVPHVM